MADADGGTGCKAGGEDFSYCIVDIFKGHVTLFSWFQLCFFADSSCNIRGEREGEQPM